MLPTLCAITRTRFEVKRSKVNVSRPINTETESVSPTKFKLGTAVGACAINCHGQLKACKVGFLHAGGGIPCRPHPEATQLVINMGC